jgi:phosphatidate cytidylyltransferase
MLYILLPFLFLTLGHKPGKLIPNYNYSYYLSFFILIWVNDTFAYLSGKFTGKHKLYENISPNKTIEGFIGGIIFTISAGFVLKNLHWIEVSNPVNIIALCLLISISATLGDLFESKLKRMAGVKDSGNIMPGHGGFLDRFDGLLFAAPVYIIFSNLF